MRWRLQTLVVTETALGCLVGSGAMATSIPRHSFGGRSRTGMCWQRRIALFLLMHTQRE
jgi:hypothetical protein